MLSCRESARLIAESQERRLSWKERVQLHFHLRACEICRRYKRQLEFLRAALKKAGGWEVSEARLSPQARQRILTRIREIEESSSG